MIILREMCLYTEFCFDDLYLTNDNGDFELDSDLSQVLDNIKTRIRDISSMAKIEMNVNLDINKSDLSIAGLVNEDDFDELTALFEDMSIYTMPFHVSVQDEDDHYYLQFGQEHSSFSKQTSFLHILSLRKMCESIVSDTATERDVLTLAKTTIKNINNIIENHYPNNSHGKTLDEIISAHISESH